MEMQRCQETDTPASCRFLVPGLLGGKCSFLSTSGEIDLSRVRQMNLAAGLRLGKPRRGLRRCKNGSRLKQEASTNLPDAAFIRWRKRSGDDAHHVFLDKPLIEKQTGRPRNRVSVSRFAIGSKQR